MSDFVTILSKKDIKKLTKSLRRFNILPHISYKQVIVNGVYYPYIISSNGSVYALNYRGKLNNFHEMSIRHVCDGYSNVTLTLNGKPKTFLVHRLVAEAFLGAPYDDNIQVNHKNGKKHKNNKRNLEWVTPSENIRHAYKHNLAHSLCGEKSGLSKYTEDQIREVCSLLEQNIPFKDISAKTGVNRGMIYNIFNRKLWKSISVDYDFSKYNYGKPTNRLSQIHKVCKLLQQNKLSVAEISDITGINKSTIYDILKKKYYTDISSHYKIDKYKLKV